MLLEQLPSHPGHPADVAVSAPSVRLTAEAKTKAEVNLKEAMAGSEEFAHTSTRTTDEAAGRLQGLQGVPRDSKEL